VWIAVRVSLPMVVETLPFGGLDLGPGGLV